MPAIVCGRGYDVGVIFLFSSKNEIVVTVSEMFESGPVKSRMCFSRYFQHVGRWT